MLNFKQDRFREAVKMNNIDEVKKYLKIVDPSEDESWAIRWASGWGHLEIVRLLLSDSRVDPAANNNFAIRVASINGYLEIVQLLLSDPRVDPSVDDNFAIRRVSFNGSLKMIRLLLQDPRVDFNAIENQEMKRQLLKEERKKLRNELIPKYQSIKQTSSQVTFEGKQKSQIPIDIIRKIMYQTSYQEMCSVIPGKFPPIKLLALADLLGIKYDQKTTYSELCGKVKFVLLNF